jgi:hypothetical protein
METKTTKIVRDSVWQEWVVKLYINGNHYKPADYHTDCKQDAIATAKVMVKN